MNKKLMLLLILVQFSIIHLYGIVPSDTWNDSTSKFTFSFNADLVNRYIWRGIPMSLNANIQPYSSVSYKNLTLGAWGSYGLSEPYAEIDLYLSYSAGPITVAINDYFNEDETDLSANDYFEFSDETPHSLEAELSFDGSEKIPFSLTTGIFIWGADKDTLNKNYYSTYLELSYFFAIGEYDLSLFIGGTVAEGYYADKAAIVNTGLAASREIKLSDSFTVPVSASIIVNPYAEDIFFIFGVTF